MNDRTVDNQFQGNTLTNDQLRLLQNLAALTGQGLLTGNINRNTPGPLHNILNPIQAGAGLSVGQPNVNDSTPVALDQQQHQQQQRQQQQQQHQNQIIQHEFTQRLHQQLQQIVQQSRQQQPHPSQAGETASLSIRQQQSLQNSLQAGSLTGADPQKRKRGRPPLSAPSTSAAAAAGSSSSTPSAAIDYSYVNNIITAVRNQQRDPKLQQDRTSKMHLAHQERDRVHRLAQERAALQMQLERQQQPHASQAASSLASDAASLSIRQQQTLQNSLQTVGLLPTGIDQQKRKRGRPPSSAPSTSAGSSSAAINYNRPMNTLELIKIQYDKTVRENRLKEERQREMLQQQERDRARELKMAQERAERQREFRLQQERERQRAELERQRKAQLRSALQDIDRERRRQHMIMVRNLEAYKRNEEREKTMNAMMAERNKLMERRIYQKRLEVELIKDIRKPIDDMMLKNQKPLATLNRIPGLKLPGKAFADLLMSYEFLFNFAESLDLKEVPEINTLQVGLLNLDTWAEDQFIAVLHHLCMFAIKDPRFPYTGSLKDVENLERTNEGLSQMLHFYLQVVTLNAKSDMEHEYRLYKLIEQKYFLSLNATQKAEMLAFICNELLCSQTVTKQMEDTIENVAKLRKDKWVLENEIRKYRVIKTKRELKEEAGLKAKEAALAAINTNGESVKNEDDKLPDSKDQVKTDMKREGGEEEEDKTNKSSLTNGSSLIDNTPIKRDNETDTSLQPNNTADLDDLEPGMTNDELNKKIENLTRQYNKTSNKLEKAINSMRACPLGQDRYRRRYWVLPQVGGVFVEGMESSEPEELENNKFTEEELLEYEKEQQVLNELAINAESTDQETDKMDIKEEKDDDEMDIKDDVGDVKEEDEAMDIKDEDGVDTSELKEEAKIETIENCEPDGDKEANDTSEVNDVTENNEVAEPSCEETNSLQVSSSPWFSILPRSSCDFSKTLTENVIPMEGEDSQKKEVKEDIAEGKAELSSEELRAMRHEICPALAKRLEDLEAEQYESPKKIHPQFQCGWWRITDSQQLKAVLSVLHERGTRERILHKHLTKHFQYACNSCKNSTVDFEITSYDRQLAGKNYGAPMPHTDEDSADDLKEGEEEEEEEEEEFDEETGDDKAIQQATIVPTKKSKRKKTSRSARSRRLRARAAARKKVENSKNKLAVR